MFTEGKTTLYSKRMDWQSDSRQILKKEENLKAFKRKLKQLLYEKEFYKILDYYEDESYKLFTVLNKYYYLN